MKSGASVKEIKKFLLSEMPETPYIVKPSWIHKILFIVLCVSVILIFYFFDSEEFWGSNDYILRNILAAFYLLFVLLTVGLFIRKINFTDECIIYRNLVGFTKIKRYKDIIKIVGEEENLSIKFSDKSLIKVWTSEGNVHKVLRIIKNKREQN